MIETEFVKLEARKNKLEKKLKVPVFIDIQNEKLYIVDMEGNTKFV